MVTTKSEIQDSELKSKDQGNVGVNSFERLRDALLPIFNNTKDLKLFPL